MQDVVSRMKPVALYVCLLGLSLFGCAADGRATASGSEKKTEPPSRRAVHVERSRLIELTEHVSSTGTLRPDDVVVVKSEVSGRIASMSIDLGSVVTRGQVLAQIDPTDARLRVAQARASLQQAHALLGVPEDKPGSDELDPEQVSLVRQAQATLDEARGTYERSSTLVASKLIGKADLEASRGSLLRAEGALSSAREEVHNRRALVKQREAELALAERALANTQIVSPLDGFVQLRHLSRGELVAPGTSIATVVDLDPLRLRLDIPERAASKVALGDLVSVSASDGQVHQGKVARIAPVVDEQNRTLTVEAEIPLDAQLRAGGLVRAEIELGHTARVSMVPSSAVVVFAGLEKVLRVEQGRALETVVVTGRKQEGWTELVRGLAAGVDVIVEPATLQSGDAVDVLEEHSRAEAR